MVKGEGLGKALLVVLAIGAVNWGLIGFFNFNIITSLIPQYSVWVYRILGMIGGWVLYTTFKR